MDRTDMIEIFEWNKKNAIDQLLSIEEEYESESSEYSEEELAEYAEEAAEQYRTAVDQLGRLLD